MHVCTYKKEKGKEREGGRPNIYEHLEKKITLLNFPIYYFYTLMAKHILQEEGKKRGIY